MKSLVVLSLQKGKKIIAAVTALCVFLATINILVNAVEKYLYPQKYSHFVEQYAAQYGISTELAYAVIHTESGFNSEAVSCVGACGLMQIMPETFEWLQKKSGGDSSSENIFDPQTNIHYGIYFLSMLMDEFGDEKLVAAAYHAGMWRVNQWLDDAEISPDGKTLSNIPYKDTEYYVKKIERTKKIYKRLYA